MKVVNKKTHKGNGTYIGRPSKWGNPIALNKPCPECGETHTQPGSTLACYKQYLWRKMQDESFLDELRKFDDNETLICWCKPNPCHGDVLVDAISWAKGNR